MAFNLQVGIDGSGAVRGSRTVNNALDSMGRNARSQNRQLGAIEGRLAGIGRTARTVQRTVIGLFAGAAALQVTRYADAYTKLSNQIGLVTETSTQAAVIQNELFELADRTRAPIEEIGTLYGRAALSAQELGASQGELLRFTEGVAQALAINGSNANEARGALLQLSQALGSGVVRAEEFNSILEGARPVLTAVADGLGVTVAQLRTLVLEGEITSREFFDAFQSQLGALDEKFQGTNATIGQAGTVLQNAFVQAFGTISEVTGASNGLVSVFQTLAQFIRGPFVDGIITLNVQIGQLLTAFDNLFSTVGDFARQFANSLDVSVSNTADFAEAVIKNLSNPIETFRKGIEIVTIEIVGLFDRAAIEAKGLFAALRGDTEGQTQAARELQQAYEARFDSIAGTFERSEARIKEAQDVVRSARREFDAAEIERVLSGSPTVGSVQGGGAATDTGDTEAAAKLQKEVDAFNSANNAAIRYQQTVDEINRLQAAGADETAVTNALAAAEEELNRASREKEEALREEIASFNEANNAAIAYQNVLNEIARLEAAGADPTAVANAREAAAQQFDETTENLAFLQELGKAAAQDIQGAFTDLFLSAGQGLDDFADSFGQTLQRLAANFLANQAIRFLLQSAGNIGGPVGGFFSTLAGEFDSGGRIPRGQVGIVGEKGPELVGGPANVTSRADTAAMMSPEVSLSIVNVSDPRAAVEATTNTNAGDKGIVNQIERNASDIKRALGLA